MSEVLFEILSFLLQIFGQGWADAREAQRKRAKRAAHFHSRTSNYIAKHELGRRFSVAWVKDDKTAFVVRRAHSPAYFAIHVLDGDSYDTLVYGEGDSLVHKEVVVLDKLVDWFQKH